LDDLERLLIFIERDAPVAARRFGQQIIDRVELLQTNPHLGGIIPEDDTSTYRQVLQGN
jgi:plasmid stabilization system protein ParE